MGLSIYNTGLLNLPHYPKKTDRATAPPCVSMSPLANPPGTTDNSLDKTVSTHPAADLCGSNFAISISPSVTGRSNGETPAKNLLAPSCVVKGWFLPPQVHGIKGLRVVIGKRTFVASRKQVRPEALQAHPARPDALTSGFSIEIECQPGLHKAQFQFKDTDSKWQTFCECRLRLSRFWWLWRRKTQRSANAYEQWCAMHSTASSADLERMKAQIDLFPRRPLISVLMPTYNTPEKWLRRVIDSVRNQVYPHWELCVADDNSPNPCVRTVLEQYAALDSRIKIVFRSTNGHICQASNSALEICTGEFTALLDHDDEIPPDALYHVASEILQHPEVSIFFSDEDKIDETGFRFDPYFKPGWNYELLLVQNAVSHLGVYRTSLMKEVGGFRPTFEGSQDWDLTLRCFARLPREGVRHIPRMLYFWRTLPTSTAATMQAKPYAQVAGRRSVLDHLGQLHPSAVLEDLPNGNWRVKWPIPEPAPLVSIVIPTHNRVDLLRTALDSFYRFTKYLNFEIIVIDHRSDDPETLKYLEELPAAHPQVRVLRQEGPFNWSHLNNEGVKATQGSLLLFLNNDVEFIQEDWLSEMVSQASRPDVGAVGALLLYPQGNIQHAGVVLRMTGLAGHIYRTWDLNVGAFGGGRADMVREVTAVTGACLMVRRESFLAVGGFDATGLPISYNDVDFCLKMRARGLRNIYTPFAKLIHHESVSRASLEKQSARKAEATEEARVILERWPKEFERDTLYNPNFDLDHETPVLKLSQPI